MRLFDAEYILLYFIKVISVKRNSLNNKFLPFTLIKTEAILLMDDDLKIKQSVILDTFR